MKEYLLALFIIFPVALGSMGEHTGKLERRKTNMKKTALIALALSGLAGSAFAWTWTQNSIGNYDYYRGSDGSSYSGNWIGNQYYWRGMDSCGGYHSGYGSWLGNTYYGYGH